ncbi:MAG: exodeoxyribonuclease VII large subunit, partial [Prochlorococcus sp.]
MNAESLPQFTVRDLNATIGNLLERGFAPRFLVQASVSKPQLKKGHLWMTLTDGEVSITAVAWASTLRQLSYRPDDGDGVTIVGKLNFWAARANLAVQVLDMRPSLTTVLRQFESVRALLERDGVIDEHRKRPLPAYPGCIGILTSVPSSALADMLRTARERWPTTRLLIIPIPVQGAVAARIQEVLSRLADLHQELNLDAIVVAR